MINSPSGDLTAPVWAADLTIPSPAANTSDSGCQADGLRRHAAGRDRPDAARLLRRAAQDPQRPGRRRGRDRLHQRGQPRRSRQPHRPALVQPDRRRRHRPDRWRRRSRPCRSWPAASAGPRRQDRCGCGSSPARRQLPDAERHRGDPRRRPEQGHRGRRAPRQRRHRPGQQRQRLRLGGDPRDRRAAARRVPEEQDPLHLVQRRGVRPARLGGLRRQPAAERARARSRRC